MDVDITKTPHHPDFRNDWKRKLVDVALSTSAAPSYLPSHKHEGKNYFDGGVWANNPIMIGLVDSLSCFNLERDNIQILSLGCGETAPLISQKMMTESGMFGWRKVLEYSSYLNSKNVIGQAGLLIGRDNLLRINGEKYIDNAIDLDDYNEAFSLLPTIGKKLVKENLLEIEKNFLYEKADIYKPFYG